MAERSRIGERIRAARIARGMTQEQLAYALGYGGASPVSHWEAGMREPRAKNLRKLCRALDVSADALLFDE